MADLMGNLCTAAMWRYVVNDDGKVTDIYFLTQLTPDEKVSMVSVFFMSSLVLQSLTMPV